MHSIRDSMNSGLSLSPNLWMLTSLYKVSTFHGSDQSYVLLHYLVHSWEAYGLKVLFVMFS